MSDIIFSINAVLPIFIFIAIGYFLMRIKITNDNFIKIANTLCFNFFLPTMLFYNIGFSAVKDVFNPKLIVFILGIVTAIFVISSFVIPIFVKDNTRKSVYCQSLFRSNYLLFGVFVAQNLFGDIGGQTASVVAAFVIPYFNVLATITLAYYDRENKVNLGIVLKKIITNPLIIGCALGAIYSLLNISMPEAFEKTVVQIKNVATPLALMVLGMDFKFESFIKNLKPIAMITFLKLIIIPVGVFLLAFWFGFKGVDLAVILAVYGTPVAVSAYVMSRSMNADYCLCGEIVVLTTLFSGITLFGFIYFFRSLGIF